LVDKNQWRTFNAVSKEQYAEAKKKFDAIVMAEMKRDMPRTADNVIKFYAIVLDIDDGATYQLVREDLKKYEYVLYSSGGTGLKNGDRFRVILPLNVPMPAQDWKRFNTSLSERFPYSDECFKKGIQIQYLPALNLAYEKQFFAEHHKGEWFDYQNPDDLPYVETISLEQVVMNVIFEDAVFSTSEMSELAGAIIDHQAGQLGYEERRLLAQRLKHIGMDDIDAVQVLDRVSKPGFTTSNNFLLKGANPNYAHAEGLYKHVAKGVRISALESRIVRYVASKKVLDVPQAKYDGEWTLDSNNYLSGIFDSMDFTSGNNLLISDMATGKSSTFMIDGKANPGFLVIAPLSSIVESFKGDNSLSGSGSGSGSGIGTWNQIESILREKDKTKFEGITLVVDECHGLFEDYGYKSKVINRLIDSFKYFKAVILMSGTVEAENFSSITFNKVYRVHKPSQATKNIRTMLCTKKDDVVIDHINKLTNKTIVLMNNKNLCEVVQKRISRSSLIVNADVKNTPEVQNFFKNRTMGSYDVIIGTNSIVEGLSIEDKLTDVDVVIWDDLVPERIEQFTNRFRNVTGSKNVWYFLDRKPVEALDDYSQNAVLDDARTLSSSLQWIYEAISTDTLCRRFMRQFGGDMSSDLVYMHDGKFSVSFTGVDYEYAQHRASQYRNDFAAFSQRLIGFGFNVFYPTIADGKEKSAEKIKEEKLLISEAREKERENVLEVLKADIESNTVKCEADAPELYTATYGSVQKLLVKGLDKWDAGKAITGYIEDESFFAKAHADADCVQTGETIRELVVSEIYGRTELQAHETQAIADKVIAKVLVEYFAGDAKAMSESRSWGGLVSKSHTCSTNDLNKRDSYVCELQAKSDACSTNDLYKEIPKRHFLQAKSSKAAKEILSKYIRMGKGKSKTVKGVSVRVAPIEALNLTGLHFTKIEGQAVTNKMMQSIIQKAQVLPSNNVQVPVPEIESSVSVLHVPDSESQVSVLQVPESVLKLQKMIMKRSII